MDGRTTFATTSGARGDGRARACLNKRLESAVGKLTFRDGRSDWGGGAREEGLELRGAGERRQR